MDKLPPLHALRAFEAAGRNQSIRRAAEELSVTAGAISRQVQSLEVYLGVQLFRREPKRVILTSAGERYLDAISKHLDGIRDATRILVGKRGVEVVRIRAYTTFAMKWLIPRLRSFHEENPFVEVQLDTSNEAVDFQREGLDGAVRLGDGAWPSVEKDRLISNVLVPLCSPSLMERHNIASPHDLLRVRLLHSIVRPEDWKIWLKGAGAAEVDPYAGDKFASSTLAYQAAIEGLGIMIAQKALFAEDLASGRLVAPISLEIDMEQFTYYLIYPRDRLRKEAFRKFRAWLLQHAEQQAQ